MILLVVGARPQFVKVKLLCEELTKQKIDYQLLHTGQHYDDEMSEIFFKDLEIPKPYKNLGIGPCSPGVQVAKVIEGVSREIQSENVTSVIVFGDTNSTLGGAIAADQENKILFHVEAGLRLQGGRRSCREEMNRILVDEMSHRGFCTDFESQKRLEMEGLEGIVTGDLMYETFLKYKPERTSHDPFFILTLHRQENMEKLPDILKKLKKSPYPILFPCHPRTRKYLKNVPKQIEVVNPVGYKDMLQFVVNSRAVFTDSGGLQKESVWAERPCYVLREESEWFFMFGWSIVNPNLDEIFKNEDWERPRRRVADYFSGFQDASVRIVNHLQSSVLLGYHWDPQKGYFKPFFSSQN